MSKKNLNLKQLKVESFVTSKEDLNTETIKGGVGGSCVPTCNPTTLPQSIYCVQTEVCSMIACSRTYEQL